MNEQVSDEKPLVTFALFAYNQEKYIREAVEGALAQTYSPLQIILSDDCSSDRTFVIMQEMAANYTGPHAILLNRNEPNLGLAGHINHVMTLAKGELIVVAAGDDISVATRVDELVQSWSINSKNTGIIYSDINQIDFESKLLKFNCHQDFSNKSLSEFVDQPFALICSYAFTRSVWDSFSPLSENLRNEDFIFPFRTLLLGKKIVYLKKSLVMYRIGVGVSSWQFKKKNRKAYISHFNGHVLVWQQIISDFKYKYPENELLRKCEQQLRLSKAQLKFCQVNFFAAIAMLPYIKISFYKKLRFFLRFGMPNIHKYLTITMNFLKIKY